MKHSAAKLDYVRIGGRLLWAGSRAVAVYGFWAALYVSPLWLPPVVAAFWIGKQARWVFLGELILLGVLLIGVLVSAKWRDGKWGGWKWDD